MQISFNPYVAGLDYSIKDWTIDLLNQLQIYLDRKLTSISVKRLSIGLLLVDDERAKDKHFQPRRNKYTLEKSLRGINNELIPYGKVIEYEFTVLNSDLLSCNDEKIRSEFLVGKIIDSFKKVKPFVVRKKLDVDFDILSELLISFLRQ